jgi:hypothetical protein
MHNCARGSCQATALTRHSPQRHDGLRQRSALPHRVWDEDEDVGQRGGGQAKVQPGWEVDRVGLGVWGEGLNFVCGWRTPGS